LYGRPRFTHDERLHFFSLTPDERAVTDGHYSLESRVLFILQAGYFKAKTMFFTFEFPQVREDVLHVLQHHYPLHQGKELTAPVLKQTRYNQQQKLLALYDYRLCDAAERAALAEKASQLVRLSGKPIYLFQALVQYLETRRIVATR